MPDFGLAEDDVRWTLNRVHRFQCGWMLAVGAILAIAPQRRFGNSYQFIVETQGGQYILAVFYIAVGLAIFAGMRWERRSLTSWALFAGGLANGLFGFALGMGALFGPTGVMGAPFAIYVAAHMMYQSELLGHRKRRG